MPVITQLLIQDPPDNLSKYCKSPKESCKFCKKLSMMPWINWCDAYNKRLEKRYDQYYPVRLSECELQFLVKRDESHNFVWNEI